PLDMLPLPLLPPPAPVSARHSSRRMLPACNTGSTGAPSPNVSGQSAPACSAATRSETRVSHTDDGVSPDSAIARSSAPGPQRSTSGSVSPCLGASAQAGAPSTTPYAARGQLAATDRLDSSADAATAAHDPGAPVASPYAL